jgi:transposase
MKTKEQGAPEESQRPPLEYNTLPTHVTRKEFNRFIRPYLSMGTRGTKPKLSAYKIFNHVLYILHTGCQWKSLPVKGIHWTNIYKHHNRWSKDGTYKKVFEGSLHYLADTGKFDLSVLHGDGSNVVAKKGAHALATRGTNTKEAKKALISKTM